MDDRSHARQLADALISGGVDQLVAERRAAGDSWREIARAIYDATDRKVDLTDETIRRWYAEQASA
jgi:hypothetical protein